MSKMNSKFKYMYDAAPAASLLPKDHAAHTASFNGAPLAFDTLHGYWTSGELADQTFAVAINVEAVDHTTGDEAYTIELEVGPAGFATTKTVAIVSAVPAPGQYVMLLDADTIAAVKADAAQMRLKFTLAGTTPSIAAHAWISGIVTEY